MTIARDWAYVKHMLREEGDTSMHYEFMTARAAMRAEFKHWRQITRPGMKASSTGSRLCYCCYSCYNGQLPLHGGERAH